ncbi:hypothetical protein SELMODRAFT_134544, partial [Selaginella moellendorffii]
YIEKLSREYASLMRVNYYPPCPQPDEVLGLSSHSDATIITVVIEDADGPSCKDGKWLPVSRILPGAS